MQITLRSRGQDGFASESVVEWKPRDTAVVVCDMWDAHWCRGATARVNEMAPVMNRVLTCARGQGMVIIHAPSDTLDFYAGTPQRLRAQSAPDRVPPAAIPRPPEPPLPVDDSDGGCDCDPPCPQGYPWTRQHPSIEIAEEDAITDSGREVYNLLAERGITNVIIMGVHTNMCVLGRSFGIRQLVKFGLHTALARDLTDTMYNSRSFPRVSHFLGTELVIAHIEEHWCPTLLSTNLGSEAPFRFAGGPE